MIGKVIEVFIPNENLDMIGFKIQIDDDVIELVQEQNETNKGIYREDIVSISYNNDSVNIEKVEYE